MVRKSVLGLLVVFVCGCFAIVDNQEEVSNVKTFLITDDETLDLLDKVEAKNPEEKHEIKLFKRN